MPTITEVTARLTKRLTGYICEIEYQQRYCNEYKRDLVRAMERMSVFVGDQDDVLLPRSVDIDDIRIVAVRLVLDLVEKSRTGNYPLYDLDDLTDAFPPIAGIARRMPEQLGVNPNEFEIDCFEQEVKETINGIAFECIEELKAVNFIEATGKVLRVRPQALDDYLNGLHGRIAEREEPVSATARPRRRSSRRSRHVEVDADNMRARNE